TNSSAPLRSWPRPASPGSAPRARALLLALDHVDDQLEHLIDAGGLSVAMLKRLAPVGDVALGGELVEVRARHLDANLCIGSDVLRYLRSRELDPVHLRVVPGAQVQPRDELELLQRRHVVKEALDGGLDQG